MATDASVGLLAQGSSGNEPSGEGWTWKVNYPSLYHALHDVTN